MDRTRPTHAIWLLLAATLLLRALVPAGWMPDVDRSDAIVAKMCNSAMTVTIPLGRERVPDDSAAQHSAPCLFAGFASDAPLGGSPGLLRPAFFLFFPPPCATADALSSFGGGV